MAVQFSDTTFQALLLTSILPIVSFVLIMIFTRENPKLSLGISLTASTIPLIIAWWLLCKYWGIQEPLIYNFKWLYSDMVKIPFGFLLDPTSLLMLTIVASISWMVQVYSIGYMDGDPGFGRFYAFLSLFAFSMLTLTISSGLLQLYICWELVGLASYLLIGFWYEKFSASEAGKKAFRRHPVRGRRLFHGPGLSDHLLRQSGNPPDKFRGRGQCHALMAHRHLGPADFLRRHGQERPVPHPRLAARRHGRSDAGQRPVAFRHHGGRRRLPHRQDLSFLQCVAHGYERRPGSSAP